MKKRQPRAARIREQILKEWRGCNEVTNLNAGIHHPQDFITSILRKAGAEEGLQEDQVRKAWQELAGDFISRHAEPASVKNGILVLNVTQPAMRFHLDQMKPMLLKRIQERLGSSLIRSIKFNHG